MGRSNTPISLLRIGTLAMMLSCWFLTFEAFSQGLPPTARSTSLLEEAQAAETAQRYDLAIDRLYQLVFSRPRTPESQTARFRLARLLALTGDLPEALLQSQMLRDELPTNDPQQQRLLDLETTLARRFLRAQPSAQFGAVDTFQAQGLTALDEPTAVVMESAGTFLVVDRGGPRAYRVTPGASTSSAVNLPGAVEPTSVVVLPDQSVGVAGKLGISLNATAKPAFVSATWGGRPRQLKKIRAMAANSRGDLFIVDEDFDGLLRCKPGAVDCAPWGPPGELRTVKVGLSDFVYMLQANPGVVRVLDDGGKQLATIGPTIGTSKFEKLVDIAVDGAYAVYLLDADLRRIQAVALRAKADRISVDPVGSVVIPAEGVQALKNPSALGVSPNGTLVVAGRSSPRLLRVQ